MKKACSCLILILAVCIGGYIYFNLQVEKQNDNPFGDKNFEISEGEKVEQIIDSLKNEGFVKNKILLSFYIKLKNVDSKFKAGTFNLNTQMSIKELVAQLTKKRFTPQVLKLTFIEGWTNTQIANYLEKNFNIEVNDFFELNENFSAKQFEFLKNKPAYADLEGYLYPDTYEVFVEATLEDIILKMLNNFDKKLTYELREEIKNQNMTIHEVITLASIVEKEMFGYENRQIVAGIFKNRLQDNYPLQSDATVNYITQKGTTRPSLDDTKIQNPYNTYQNKGLPPGPICNPSIEAIKAVIYSKQTPYYFFLTTPDNKIIFSKNHEEHIINRNKYLQ